MFLQKIAFWVLDKDLGLPIWVPLGQVTMTLSDYLTEDWLSLSQPMSLLKSSKTKKPV